MPTDLRRTPYAIIAKFTGRGPVDRLVYTDMKLDDIQQPHPNDAAAVNVPYGEERTVAIIGGAADEVRWDCLNIETCEAVTLSDWFLCIPA